MKMNLRSIKGWMIIVVIAIVAGMLAPQPVAATGTCPAPGTDLAGAKNMVADPTMGSIAMTVDNPNGNIGMRIAVINTLCN